jgi:hypothetical protein
MAEPASSERVSWRAGEEPSPQPAAASTAQAPKHDQRKKEGLEGESIVFTRRDQARNQGRVKTKLKINFING